MAASSSRDGLDLARLAASAGKLPEPLQGCVFDVSTRAWIPPRAIGSQPAARHVCFLGGYTHQVEKTRKATACRRCGENIEKAAVRVGYPTKGSKGEFGVVVLWCHAACGRQDPVLVDTARGGDRCLRRRILGYDALRKEERLKFCNELSRPMGQQELLSEVEKLAPPAPTPKPRLEPHEPPAALRGSLLPFQREGLGWMLAREADGSTRGGILADEMGMGKTLQAIALILAGRARGPTLVVCPAATIQQWGRELLRFSEPGSLTVLLHYSGRVYEPEAVGPERTVVLTTYGTVEKDYRREVLKTRVPCRWCRKLFLSAKLKWHNRYYCGPDAKSRETPLRRHRWRGIKRTLTLGGMETFIEINARGGDDSADEAQPPSRRSQSSSAAPSQPSSTPPPWKRPRQASPTEPSSAPEAAAPPPPPPPQPPPKPTDPEDECEFDLSQAPLFCERWGRVILDEAHRIKGRTNSTAQAVFELRVRKKGARWCLSGTPIQNKVGEVWSLLRFLRFYPYAYYFCAKRGCDCSMLRHVFDPDTSRCRKCGHTRLQHQSHFNADVSNPVKRFGFVGAGKAAMERLRREVLEKLLLRRTKAERMAEIQLRPVKLKVKQCELSSEERDIYTATYTKSRTQFDSYVAKGTVLHHYAHIFDLILKLRQAANHPYLITHRHVRSFGAPAPLSITSPAAELALTDAPDDLEGISTGDVCTICEDVVDLHTARMAQCGHIFHRRCLVEYLDEAPKLASGYVNCPACYGPLDDDDASAESAGEEEQETREPERAIVEAAAEPEDPLEFVSSTKIDALVEDLQRMIERKPGSKALVFSQFVRFLQLIEWRLQREGLRFAKFDGRLMPKMRNGIVDRFNEDPDLKILLISLRAGAEGLNLQVADHVFLMDPWWNPASENQAIQRTHRLGQTRRVVAKRFVAADTIEERIIELQKKKQSIFDVTIGGTNQALQQLTAEDIEFLFGSGGR